MITLTVNHTTDGFVLSFPYNPDLVSAVKSLPKRRFDPASKRWVVAPASAPALHGLLTRLDGVAVDYQDDSAEALASAVTERVEAIVASRAADFDGELPVPEGLSYLPYQRAGIAYGLTHPCVLFGDEMGLGKTIQAAGVINADETIRTGLVVCPASLLYNWRRELEKWLTRRAEITILSGEKPSRALIAHAFRGRAPVQLAIVNYDVIHKWAALLPALDCLILDEAHYLKNPKARRTQQILGKWDRDPEKEIPAIPARRRLALTGTPIPNRPIEGWTLFHALAPETFPSWREYVTRYCAGYQGSYGWVVDGASNLGELQEKLRASLMVRRLKADVLTELPPKRRQVIDLDPTGCEDVLASEDAAFHRHEAALADAAVAVELAKAEGEAAYRAAVNRLRDAQAIAFTEMSQQRHLVALATVPQVIAHLTDVFEAEGTDKVLCFGHHKDVIAAIVAAFPGQVVSITGSTPKEDRQGIVDRFQSDPQIKLFVGNILAAGVGLTLTAAAHVVFAELDWVPGNVTQAEDRAHRIGQTNSVLVQHLVLDGSLSATMARRLVAKQAVIDAALDVERPTLLDEPLLVIRDARPAATAGATVAAIEAEAHTLTPEQRIAILAGLQRLAAVCDGAVSDDGHGFSGMDVRIGHSLARQDALTPRQAALGLRLVTKYRRQLGPELVAAAKGGV